MNIRKHQIGLIFLIIYLSGCTTSYNSLKSGNSEEGMKIIAAPHNDVLSAAYEAISSEFPSANINEITGYQSGFSWFHVPILDRTDFKLITKQVTGLTPDGTDVEGYAVSITTSGTQALVDARYVQPLVRRLDATLLERGIEKLEIAKVTYSKNPGDKSAYNSNTLSTGTGFFVSNSGHLITNYHVIENSNDISIVLSNPEFNL
jgi:S1-C subfamily serine protease